MARETYRQRQRDKGAKEGVARRTHIQRLIIIIITNLIYIAQFDTNGILTALF